MPKESAALIQTEQEERADGLALVDTKEHPSRGF